MDKKGQIIFHKDFHFTINAIKEVNLSRFDEPSGSYNFNSDMNLNSDSTVAKVDDEIKSLKPKNGEDFIKNNDLYFGGYDESTFDYNAIEGGLYLTSHSFVVLAEHDWIPINFLTNYFVTRSKMIADRNDMLQYSDDPASFVKAQYAMDRSSFITDVCPKNLILFIDGPLIGQQINHYTVSMVKDLHENGISPIFFVKNSNSNLVTESLSDLRNQYNSDMHWASSVLDIGQCTNWYQYTDHQNVKEYKKIFCYIKPFADSTPQRIEMYPLTYNLNHRRLDDLLDCIYYFMLENGSKSNPQIRPIAIAEKYARASKKIMDINKLIKSAGLIPTMNQERGFS